MTWRCRSSSISIAARKVARRPLRRYKMSGRSMSDLEGRSATCSWIGSSRRPFLPVTRLGLRDDGRVGRKAHVRLQRRNRRSRLAGAGARLDDPWFTEHRGVPLISVGREPASGLISREKQIKRRALSRIAGDAYVPSNVAHKGAHLRET